MLTLHLEAEDHQALAILAIKTLGIVAVEKHELNAPQAIVVGSAAAMSPAPTSEKAVELPKPEPRATRAKKTATPTPPPAPQGAVQPAPTTTADNATALPLAKSEPGTSSPTPAPAVPTVDEVRYALSEVNGLFGMAVCTSILGLYGAERVSLVPEDKRAAFIAECTAKVAAEKARLAAAAAAAK